MKDLKKIINEIIKSSDIENSCISQISPGLFKIGKNGPITGIGGLKQFDEAMKNEEKKYQ